MPNIFKNFWKPAVNQYVFPDVDEIEVEPDKPEPAEDAAPEDAAEAAVESKDPEEKANASSVIRYAKVQADEILADAHRQADSLLEQLRKQSAEAAEQARQDAHDEGYRQGYAEGLRQAQVESQAKMEEQFQDQQREVRDFLDQASRAKDEMIDSTREELLDLCIAVAEKVIHISLRSSREVIAKMIQVATEKLKRREWVHIYVGGCSAKEISQIAPELTASLSGLSEHIKITPMPEDESGTCIIEMPDAILDASASTQLKNIREILSGS